MAPRHIAVLGGGISGLTSAFYLARYLPRTSRITLIEKSNRVGGWIKSYPIEGSKVALEAGPRTFRGGNVAFPVVQLVRPYLRSVLPPVDLRSVTDTRPQPSNLSH